MQVREPVNKLEFTSESRNDVVAVINRLKGVEAHSNVGFLSLMRHAPILESMLQTTSCHICTLSNASLVSFIISK